MTSSNGSFSLDLDVFDVPVFGLKAKHPWKTRLGSKLTISQLRKLNMNVLINKLIVWHESDKGKSWFENIKFWYLDESYQV